MKKRLAVIAAGLALTGAAAVPAGSAFGTSAAGSAIRCQILLAHIVELHNQFHATTDTNQQAFIAAVGNKLLTRYFAKGCSAAALPTLP